MGIRAPRFLGVLHIARDDSRGVTGLETAIVLIAFVVVSSVFAFATLSTGLFSSDQAKRTIHAGLSEARGTLSVKGGVVINATTTGGETGISGSGGSWTLTSTPVLSGSETVGSADGTQILTIGTDYSITYDTGAITLTSATSSSITADYTTYSVDSVEVGLGNSAGGAPVLLTPGETVVTYQDDDTLSTNITNFSLSKLGNANADNLLEKGETFLATVTVSSFGLTDKDSFTIQIKPPTGAVVLLKRRIPDRIVPAMTLE